jgi:hypothetical protein
MYSDKHTVCVLCVLAPMLLAGVIGFFAGSIALFAGCKPSTSHTVAGFSGFMGAQAFNYVCLLLTTRYRRGVIRRRVKQRIVA